MFFLRSWKFAISPQRSDIFASSLSFWPVVISWEIFLTVACCSQINWRHVSIPLYGEYIANGVSSQFRQTVIRILNQIFILLTCRFRDGSVCRFCSIWSKSTTYKFPATNIVHCFCAFLYASSISRQVLSSYCHHPVYYW